MKAKKKKKNSVEFSTSTIEVFEDHMNTSSLRLASLVESSGKNFSVLEKTKIFDKGSKNVKKGYSEVKQSLNNYVSVLKDYQADVKVTEEKYIDTLDGIEIPHYLDLNAFQESMLSEYKNLNKKDGKAVKAVSSKLDNLEVMESTAVTKDALVNIAKEADLNEIKYQDVTDNNEFELLTDLTHADSLDAVAVYDSATAISAQKLDDISKYTESNVQKLKDYYEVNKANLKETGKKGEALKTETAVDGEFQLLDATGKLKTDKQSEKNEINQVMLNEYIKKNDAHKVNSYKISDKEKIGKLVDANTGIYESDNAQALKDYINANAFEAVELTPSGTFETSTAHNVNTSLYTLADNKVAKGAK